jgi:L-lactate dehydrogenase complex protein LldF
MSRPAPQESFRGLSTRALADAQLQRALTNATTQHAVARTAAITHPGAEWEALRERAKEIKDHTLSHLDYYLEEFTRHVERLGGHVFWAEDAAAANAYITSVARRHGVTLAVKSKSMMTEEIDLNSALAAAGVEAVETDLGEYIVQLAGERPSHITAPAVHKTRGDIARLMREKLSVECEEDPASITAHARRVLREKFLSAGMGVTGVNFAVAETGSIVLVENEGNIRLTTSLPRVHVALMGIEKVIPRMADLGIFLRLLPLGASGQKITSYISILTGGKRAPLDEGPEEFHVVILDNGRTEILANTHLRESLNCIRCGACLNACPVYQKIGGHAYGWIYPGPIGAVLTPQLLGREKAADLPFASTLCGACRDVCPVKINLPEMLLHLRHEIKEPATSSTVVAHGARKTINAETLSPASELKQRTENDLGSNAPGTFKRRFAVGFEHLLFKGWAFVIKSSSRYRMLMRLARLGERLLPGQRAYTRLPPFSRWTTTRELPPLPVRSFTEQWPEISRAAGSPQAVRGDDSL